MKIIKTKKYAQISQGRWNKTPGELYIEIQEGSMGGIYDITNDRYMSSELSLAISESVPFEKIKQNHGIELAIDFSSSGYNDPGSMYGGPDNVGYPPEGEDERTVTSVKLLLDGALIGSLSEDSKNVNRIVEQEYTEEMKNADLDIEYDEDPRGDYEYDLSKDEPRRFNENY